MTRSLFVSGLLLLLSPLSAHASPSYSGHVDLNSSTYNCTGNLTQNGNNGLASCNVMASMNSLSSWSVDFIGSITNSGSTQPFSITSCPLQPDSTCSNTITMTVGGEEFSLNLSGTKNVQNEPGNASGTIAPTGNCAAAYTWNGTDCVAPPSPPTCTLTPSPSSITSGNSATLTWTTTNTPTSFSIDQNIGGVSPATGGSVAVSPTATITYTGTATNAGGSGTCSTTVTVTAPVAPTCTLSASPSSIASGGSSQLSWSTTNATSFSINQGIGTVTPTASGYYVTSPTANTTYKGTATGAGGTSTCSTSVTVSASGENGSCAGTHYNCLSSTASTNQVNGTYQYSWTCPGKNGGSDAFCTESKPFPDLIAGSITPTSAQLNTPTTFSSTITNQGTASTGNSFNVLFQKATSAAGAGATDLGYVSLTALSNGSSRSASYTYTPTATGTFYMRACADKSSSADTGVITESNEGNNCAGTWTAVTVPSAGSADLITEYFKPTVAPISTATTFYVDTVNIGQSSSVTSGTSFRMYSDAACTTSIGLMGTPSVPALAPNASSTKSVIYTTPSSAGTYYVRTCADAGNTNNAESNEGNNCTCNALKITAGTYPDLQSDDVYPRTATENVPTVFTAYIHNYGNAAVLATFTNLLQKATDSSGSNPADLTTSSMTNLGISPPMGSATIKQTQFTWTFTAAGTYYLRVCADKSSMSDATGVVNEGGSSSPLEQNNCSINWVPVVVPPICTGTAPSPLVATLYPDYNQNLTADTPYSYASPESGKCQFACNAGYSWYGSACIPDPTATLTANGNSGSTTIYVGQPVTLAWSSTGATGGCTSTTAPVTNTTSGSATVNNLMATQIYSITCSNGNHLRDATANVTVNVLQPGAYIEANPRRVRSGGTSNIAWSAWNATTCTITGPNIDGAGGITLNVTADGNGVVATTTSTQTITTQSTYTISCNGNIASDTVSVNVVPTFQTF